MNDKIYFANKCLDPKTGSADAFFNEISYQIDLTKLYNVKDTCINETIVTYCPVLLEIVNEEIIKAWNGNRYLLQVWNEDGKKVFERSLKKPMRAWNMGTDPVFIYLPDQDESNGEFLHIVQIEQSNNTLLVSQDALCPNFKYLDFADDSILYSANKSEIRYVHIDPKLFKEEDKIVDMSSLNIRTIETQLIIHGFMREYNELMVAFETADNQLDFNIFKLQNIEDEKSHTYEFVQFTEVIPRHSNDYDPVMKMVHFSNGQYTIALRRSGKFDIYWRCRRVNSPDDKYAIDIGMNATTLYFKMVDNTIYSLTHKNATDIDFHSAEEFHHPDAHHFFENLKVSYVQPNMNLFTDFKIIEDEKMNTSLYLAHGNFLSVYDIANEKWVKHTQFEGDILKYFTIKNKVKPQTGVILRNGSVFFDDKFIIKGEKPQGMQIISKEDTDLEIKDEILEIHEDVKYQQIVFVVCKKGKDERFLKCIYKQEYLELPGLDIEFKEDTNILRATNYNSFQNDDSLTDSQIVVKQFYYLSFEKCLYKYSLEEEKVKNEQLTAQPKKKMKKFIYQPKFILEEKFMFPDDIHYQSHSIVFGNDEQTTFMIFSPSFIMLRYMENNKPQTKEFKGSGVVGLWAFSSKIIYALCGQKGSEKGLRLYDMDALIKDVSKEQPPSTLLKEIMPGFNGDLQYSGSNRRLGVLESFTKILIFPELHMNVIRFMGILDKEEYLAYKVINDRYIALSKEHVLYSWSLISGKLVSTFKLPDRYNYDDYEIIEDDSSNLKMRDRFLLKSKEDIVDKNPDEFFEAYQLHKIHKKQKTFTDALEKKVKKWILIEIMNEKEVKECVTFLHPELDTTQYFYFNEDYSMMISWLFNNNNIYLYKFNQMVEHPIGHSTMQFIKKFDVWPEKINGGSEFLQILSPDFSQIMEPQKKTGEILIRDTISNSVLYNIPRNIMNLKNENNESEFFNRFKWLNNYSFIIVNPDGVEKIIDYTNDEFKEVSSNVVPFFKKEDWARYKYYILRETIELGDTLNWLKRKYRDYKSMYQLHNERDKLKYYSKLFKVNLNDEQFYDTNHSFTFLHWSIIEQIQKRELSIEDVDEDIFKTLLFNILPGGDTIIHRLCQNSMDDQILKMFKRCQPDKENLKDIQVYVPIIPNFNGQTGLHICKDKGNFKTIDHILKYIQHYHLDHCSTVIKDLIPDLIMEDIPSLLDYLDNKLISNDMARQITRGSVNKSSNGVTESSLWLNKDTIKSKLFKTNEIEPNIKCEFLDMPGVYHFEDPSSHQFYDALAASSNYQLFTKKAIQKLIDFNFKIVRYYTIMRLFIPFAAFLITFVLYLNVVYEKRFSKDADERLYWYPVDLTMMGMLGLFAFYFIMNEVKQLRQDAIEYLGSIWNYIDIVPPIGIFIMLILNILASYMEINPNFERTVQSIATFFMWFKLLYFLRIFKNTGYLIRMIIEVTYDMRFFLLVLMITIAAFGDSMLSLALGNQQGEQFIGNFGESLIFTYRLILGDWETEKFGNVAVPLVWTLFLLCTMLNMIVMLNLLIAIISQTFGRVNENAISASYQEMAAMISENGYLIPDHVMHSYAEKDRFLMIVTNLETEELLSHDPVYEKISDIHSDFKTFKKKQEEETQKIVKEQDKISKVNETLQEQLKKILLYQQSIAKKLDVEIIDEEKEKRMKEEEKKQKEEEEKEEKKKKEKEKKKKQKKIEEINLDDLDLDLNLDLDLDLDLDLNLDLDDDPFADIKQVKSAEKHDDQDPFATDPFEDDPFADVKQDSNNAKKVADDDDPFAF